MFDVVGDEPDVDWSLTNFSANAIYHFDVRRVTPVRNGRVGRRAIEPDDRRP